MRILPLDHKDLLDYSNIVKKDLLLLEILKFLKHKIKTTLNTTMPLTKTTNHVMMMLGTYYTHSSSIQPTVAGLL